jgi:hypothetical protein
MPKRTRRGGMFGVRNPNKTDANNLRDYNLYWKDKGYQWDPNTYWPGSTNKLMGLTPIQPQQAQPQAQPQVDPSQQYAADTIHRFMKKTATRRKALYLNTICANSGVCIAFGKEIPRLMSFFDFKTFEFANVLRNLGGFSANGFVKEIGYEREGYIAHAALKSSLKPSSDNLAYEYLIGKYINEQFAPYCPGFIETYGLFKYLSKWLHSMISRIPAKGTEEVKGIDVSKLLSKALIQIDPSNTATVCDDSKLLCILIQHIKNAKTLDSMMEDLTFVSLNILHVFYQIYFTLHTLKDKFTHYDLHASNVLLYVPDETGYIQYHYHLKQGDVLFKSKYMAKMIDYGRSFFPGAIEYHKSICKQTTCNPDCGGTKGFGFLDETKIINTLFINSAYKNESHDLRLLKYCYDNIIVSRDPYIKSIPQQKTPLSKLFADVRYTGEYGTEEYKKGVLSYFSSSTSINTVSDAEARIRKIITSSDEKEINDLHHARFKKIGDLHVYTDGRPMEYIEVKSSGGTRRVNKKGRRVKLR